MANVKISGLPAASTPLTGAELVPIVQSGVTSQTTVGDLLSEQAGASFVGYLPAGTGAVATTVQTKLRENVSVKDFGAVGDGTTDDTTAFVNALATGRNIFVPYGTYKITSSLNITEGSIIGEGVGVLGGQQTILMFYNLTSTTIGAIYTRISTQKGKMPTIKNLFISASSWNATTGCSGYGLDIEAPINVENVWVYGFKKSGVFFHNNASGNGPYESIFTQVKSTNNGNHGFLVGAGANVITLQSCEGKWNGAPSYGVNPSVAGSYSGLYIDNTSDGSGPYFSFRPTAISIISGDYSYNAKYGVEAQDATGLNMSGIYAEGNLSSDTYQHLANSISSSYADFGFAVAGAGKTLKITQYNNALSQGNTFIVNGFRFGGGIASSGAAAGYIYDKSISTTNVAGDIIGRVVYLGADDVGPTNATYVQCDKTTGDAIYASVGTSAKHWFYSGISFGASRTVTFSSGSGSPEGVITAAVGSIYTRTNGGAGTTLYVKESGTGNTGWVAK